jgi:hypothetical protein
VFSLSWLARRLPHVAWLQPFRITLPEISEAEREKRRRRANVYAGVELIIMAVIIPFGYFVLELMFLSETTAIEIALVGASSILLFALGVMAIRSSRRQGRR